MAATAVPPANSAWSPYVVPPRSQRPPANSAGVAPTLRRATADDLFKPHPLPPVPPRRPTEKDLYTHVEAYLRPEVDATSGLRAIVTDEFTSLPIDPPQQEGFLVPPEASWEPTHRCESTDEGTMFHQQIGPAAYIPFQRWKTHPAFMEQTRYQSLQLVGDLHIRSFGHMILVAWAARLATNDDRILYIVDFIHQVLESFDWEDEIPKLISDYQPRMVVTGTTREPWPAFRDFRIAAERWVGCCRQPFRYIFDRLTGPIVWNPRWLQSNQVPDLFRAAIRDEMTAQAELMFNNLRHMVYRKYGLRHIRAELNRQTIGWARFDNTHNRESIRNETCVRAETIIFAEEPVYDSFSARLRPDVFMAQIANGNRAAVRDAILDYYPGPEVRRVVFRIGRNYNTEDNQDGLDELIIELCHIYAQCCSYVEQFVILPPYLRVQRVRWMQTLRLLVQQDQVLPFARVIVHTTDLQYFERNRRLGIRSAWPATFHTSEDGRYLDEQAIEGRKNLLRRGHGLTLWTKYAKTAPAAKTAPDASLPILDYSAVPTPRTTRVGAANSAAPSVGSSTSTKTTTTIKTKASAGPLAANSAAGQVTQPTPLAIVPTPPLALPTSSAAPDQLQFDLAALVQQQQQILLLLQQASAQQPSLATTTSVPPKKDKPRRKDQHSDQDE